VFLVDDDQPELRHRGEHHRAGTEHDAGAAAEGVAPGDEAFMIRQSRMQHCHWGVESLPKPAQQLGGEADLGHQHERALAGAEHPLDQTQVHLGLAAAGDSVQHECAKAAEGRGRGFHGCALLG